MWQQGWPDYPGGSGHGMPPKPPGPPLAGIVSGLIDPNTQQQQVIYVFHKIYLCLKSLLFIFYLIDSIYLTKI